LCDIVKSNAEQDLSWVAEVLKVEDMALRQVQWVMEHLIKARTMLQQLSARIIKYRARAVEIREILSAPMEQHIFSYANTCEDLFVKFSKYEKRHPLK
jgi:hypothetical protein